MAITIFALVVVALVAMGLLAEPQGLTARPGRETNPAAPDPGQTVPTVANGCAQGIMSRRG
jgi:hypothetical protein